MTAVLVFCILSLFLILGKILRVYVSLLQKLYLPSSIIGGAVALVVFKCFPCLIPADVFAAIGKLPGFLINVVFAALFLGVTAPKFSKMIAIAFPQLCFGQFIAWGQYVLGLGLTGFVLTPLFGLSPAFGNLLEIGFEGGHGTVGGMSAVFEQYDWSDGIALGYTVATVGMIVAITVGMVLVNWANRRGHVHDFMPLEEMDRLHLRGIYRRREQPAAGRQTVLCDSIDSLAWHCALIGAAVAIGYAVLFGCRHLEILLFPKASVRVFSGFPLFPLCMIGGLAIQHAFQRLRIAPLIDGNQMKRISGASLDFLVVSAIATIRIEVVLQNWLPLLILIGSGALLSVLMVLFVAPRLFRDAWFERAIADFGQSLGVTATGLLLLRTVDPESKTEATAAFGYKQLLHEPFMGGGIVTALALTLVFTVGWLPVFIASTVFFLFWGALIVAVILRNRKK
jgi:ESS family glutamate:Na+ symporter